ncbi:MAG: hypothetical protein CMJ21_03135 [Phycisphaerae bacterium]|nr:hypothetical protein [Phycisphaerae bacterium]
MPRRTRTRLYYGVVSPTRAVIDATHDREHGARRSRHGFTLVEILVVISILALLVGILVPALSGSRRKAKSSACQGHLNAIGKGFGMYHKEENNYYPGSFVNGSPPSGHDLLGDVGSNVATAADARPLNGYVSKSKKVARCAADAGVTGSGAEKAWEFYGSSYYYYDRNAAQINANPPALVIERQQWTIEGHRASEVLRESKKMILADVIIKYNAVAPWHDDTNVDPKINMLFADGHAEFLVPNPTGGDMTTTDFAVVKAMVGNSSISYY